MTAQPTRAEVMEFEDAWEAWTAQCAKRGQWQTDPVLPTSRAVARLEAAARRVADAEGLTVSAVLDRQAASRRQIRAVEVAA